MDLLNREFSLPLVPATFTVFVEFALEGCKQIRDKKGAAYANGEDVLRNFKRLVQETKLNPKLPWYIFLEKHVSAVKKWAMEDLQDTGEPLEGRFYDIINYCLLGLGLLYEERQNAANTSYQRSGDKGNSPADQCPPASSAGSPEGVPRAATSDTD